MGAAQQRLVDWVFLDRDGTINQKPPDGDYVTGPAQLALLPGAARAIRCLNDAGARVAIITNQRGIALGRMTEADFAKTQARLERELLLVGAHVDAVYYCPHAEGTCACRKPGAGMLLKARRELGDIDFRRAAVIGDSARDIGVGRRVGALTFCITAEKSRASSQAHHVVPSLERAVQYLIPDGPASPAGVAAPR